MALSDGHISWQPPTALSDPQMDWPLLIGAVMLATVGLIMMASASIDYAELNYGSPFYHVIRHSIYLVIATLAGLVAYSLPTTYWSSSKSGAMLIILGIVLAVLVLIIGREVNGSKRWIALGPITIQVSEMIKPIVVIFIAGYLVRQENDIKTRFWGFAKPLIILGLFVILLLLEPDFGAAVVMSAAALGLMFLGGVKLWQFACAIVLCVGAGFLAISSSEYRMRRILAFTDPWANQYDSGYQLTQSLIAFGRGEWLGVGLGNSVQKLFYLPEAHTDFIYAILAEELGVIGAIAVVLGFVFLIGRMVVVGRSAESKQQFFFAYVCYGFSIIFSVQAFFNIGVNVGMLPTKGLTLPLISYGGSSLIVCFMMIAAVLRISHEVKNIDLKSDKVDVKNSSSRKKPARSQLRGAYSE